MQGQFEDPAALVVRHGAFRDFRVFRQEEREADGVPFHAERFAENGRAADFEPPHFDRALRDVAGTRDPDRARLVFERRQTQDAGVVRADLEREPGLGDAEEFAAPEIPDPVPPCNPAPPVNKP